MNFVFISPNFPKTYYRFAKALLEQGFNVLAIADCNYEQLSDELKGAITDYYKVDNMTDYMQMYRAVAYFAFKYGPIDFIESNNEFYLEQDAKLREAFNVNTGKKLDNINMYKSKELEKKYYKQAGVKTPRYIIIQDYISALKFANKVGYPLVAKPDSGVGASKTYKINDEEQLKQLFNDTLPCKYIMEEFVDGKLVSFDGVSDANAEVVFCSNEIFPNQIMDVVNNNSEMYYYCNIKCSRKLYIAGSKVLKAFDAKYRYFHLEFFILNNDKKGLGKKGDIIGLEVNMRAPGGYSPDMINLAHSVDSYKIWAEVMKNNYSNENMNNEKYYCIYVGKRNGNAYLNDDNKIKEKYCNNITMHEYMPEILSSAMGNEFYIAKFKTLKEMNGFKNFVYEKRK